MSSESQELFLKNIEENRGIIYRICKMYEDDLVLQEDLFQEIVLQSWKAYANFRAESKFSTWLYRVALNTAITYLKREKRRVESRSFSISNSLQIAEEIDETEKEQLESLYRAISKLDKIEKALVILYLEDKSYEEISEILGISVSNVGAKLTRTRNKLRKKLNPSF